MLSSGVNNCSANAVSLQDFSYTYDLLGNVSSILDPQANGTQTQSFAYDPLQRLVSLAASGGTQDAYLLESKAGVS